MNFSFINIDFLKREISLIWIIKVYIFTKLIIVENKIYKCKIQ